MYCRLKAALLPLALPARALFDGSQLKALPVCTADWHVLVDKHGNGTNARLITDHDVLGVCSWSKMQTLMPSDHRLPACPSLQELYVGVSVPEALRDANDPQGGFFVFLEKEMRFSTQ